MLGSSIPSSRWQTAEEGEQRLRSGRGISRGVVGSGAFQQSNIHWLDLRENLGKPTVDHGSSDQKWGVSHTISKDFPYSQTTSGKHGWHESCQPRKSSGALYCDELKAAQLRTPTTVSGVKQAEGFFGGEGQVDLEGWWWGCLGILGCLEILIPVWVWQWGIHGYTMVHWYPQMAIGIGTPDGRWFSGVFWGIFRQSLVLVLPGWRALPDSAEAGMGWNWRPRKPAAAQISPIWLVDKPLFQHLQPYLGR